MGLLRSISGCLPHGRGYMSMANLYMYRVQVDTYPNRYTFIYRATLKFPRHSETKKHRCVLTVKPIGMLPEQTMVFFVYHSHVAYIQPTFTFKEPPNIDPMAQLFGRITITDEDLQTDITYIYTEAAQRQPILTVFPSIIEVSNKRQKVYSC